MNETTENFLKVMAEFVWPEHKPIVYKVYHDDAGFPISYTQEDLPGNYIEITPEDFWLASMESRVIDGRLVHPVKTHAVKLRPSDQGTTCHPQDVCVVVQDVEKHTRWRLS